MLSSPFIVLKFLYAFLLSKYWTQSVIRYDLSLFRAQYPYWIYVWTLYSWRLIINLSFHNCFCFIHLFQKMTHFLGIIMNSLIQNAECRFGLTQFLTILSFFSIHRLLSVADKSDMQKQRSDVEILTISEYRIARNIRKQMGISYSFSIN